MNTLMKMALMALATLGATSLAVSQTRPAPDMRFIERLDADGDGVLSQDEVAAARQRLFARLDRDGDDAIDDREIEALRDAVMDRAVALQARLGRAWRRMDTNGDGRVSAEEFRARTILFDVADRDGDGRLSSAEIAFMRDLILGRRG